MNKIKFGLLVIVVTLLAGNALFAQSVEQGRKFYYYERYQSARQQFEKVLAANPNNVDAIYWLGQTLIDDHDSIAAKALYQKALVTNPNAPLVLVGVGHIELLEGKTNEARQHFETAISLSKGKDIDVLNAVGKANAQARNGDAQYAIEKLTQATLAKKFNTPGTYIYMGVAYLKLGGENGGDAVKSFTKAMQMDPTLAEPKYKIGMVYRTQNNSEAYLPYFQDAVEADSTYAPALYELFYHWYYRDIDKAAVYFDKYLAVSDPKPSNEYDKVSIMYARKAFNDAITAAKQKIAANPTADPRYYKLIAYAYNELKDPTEAKNYLDQYFGKQKPEGFVSQDYLFRAQLLSKFPGNDAAVLESYQAAIDKDTTYQSKLNLMDSAAVFANKIGNHVEEANWRAKIYAFKKESTNRDMYNWGYANYLAKQYDSAQHIFCDMYQPKYPTEIFGYLWCAKAAAATDTTMQKGAAVEPYKRLIVFADSSSEKYKKYKSFLLQAHGYLATYYVNIAKQKDSAIAQLESILELDPTNVDALRYIKILKDSGKKDPGTSGKPSGQANKPDANKSPAVKK